MARRKGSGRRLFAHRHFAVGLGLLSSSACGGEMNAVERKSGDPGMDPRDAGSGGMTSGGAGGASPIFVGTGGTGLMVFPALTCDLPPLDPTAADPLSQYVVSPVRVGRRTLYSWTSKAQIDELRQDPTLLTRSASVTGERGRASDYIRELATTNEIAALLAGPKFEKKRFAWPSAWATALGWEGETYGDQLLEIRLRAESWIGRLSTLTGEWAFFDVDSNPVALEDVKKSPERIAGFYFVDETATGCGGTFRGAAPYREYVICNEAMIEEWSAYTGELRTHLTTAIAALGALRDELARAGCTEPIESVRCFQQRVVGTWNGSRDDSLGSYEAALAFPNEFYVPTVSNVEQLTKALESLLFVPSPLRHSYQGDAGP